MIGHHSDIPRLIDVKELSHITSLQHSAIYEYIKAGEFRPIKLGRKTVFSADEVARWVRKKVAGASGQVGA